MFSKIFLTFTIALIAITSLAQTPEKEQVVVKKSILLNFEALKLPAPIYPPQAKAAKLSGQVVVEVAIDKNGKVISAQANSGPQMLRSAAEKAAMQAEFDPVFISRTGSGGILIYNFAPDGTATADTDNAVKMDWSVAGIMLANMSLVPSLRYTQPRAVASMLPHDWITEQQQLTRIEELKELELQSDYAVTPKVTTLSDGKTKVVSGASANTTSPEARALTENIVASIRSKLGSRPLDLWYFDLGYHLGSDASRADSRDEIIRKNSSASLRAFIETAPPEISPELIVELQTLIGYIERGVFDVDGKMAYTEQMRKVDRLIHFR